MEIETLFWIIGILFGILTLIGWIIKNIEKTGIKNKIGKIIYNISWRLAIFPVVFIINGWINRSYYIDSAQDLWTEYHLPQLDSKLHLTYNRRGFYKYESVSKDSVFHSSKSMKYDMFDLECEDRFINKSENKELTIEFTKAAILRDALRTITLKDYNQTKKDSRKTKNNIDTLTNLKSDSILISWGFKNIYTDKLVD